VRRKMVMQRDIFSILGVAVCIAFFVVLAALTGGCGGEEDSSPPVEDGQEEAVQETVESTEQQSTEEPEASVGDTVMMGNVEWTVTDVLQSDILVSRLGIEEGNFVIVDVTFQNNSNQDITLATPFATLVDSQGREVEADTERNFLHVYAEENLFVDHVKPGATKDARVIFSVEEDASGFKLKVGEARFASDETEYIDLGI
jgi:hypothetical protein